MALILVVTGAFLLFAQQPIGYVFLGLSLIALVVGMSRSDDYRPDPPKPDSSGNGGVARGHVDQWTHQEQIERNERAGRQRWLRNLDEQARKREAEEAAAVARIAEGRKKMTVKIRDIYGTFDD